ncbi:MAG TPA: hypothetical protein VL172_17480 [Kofleriaceae bacterium]|nr:hypothetical protein [Kofleriaceae bacterium]
MMSPAKPGGLPAPLPPRKPMRSARRVSLFEREIRIRLSAAAIDILFELAAVLSEGQVDGDHYFGSTMITFDLGRAGGLVSDECDEATARRVAELLGGDDRVLARARALGAREAARLAGVPLQPPQIDISARRTGRHLHLDLDIESTVAEEHP